jgi:hypothetical protein
MRPKVSTTRAISMAALLLTLLAVLPGSLHGQIRPLRALLTIRALDGGAESISAVPVRLNFDRSVSWVAKGNSEPPVYDTNGVPEVVVTVLLHFDTSGSGNDVSKLVQPLDQMASIDVNLGRPPLVQVQFGAIDFKGVISSIAAKYTDFKEDGTPVRADVDVKIKVAASAEVGVAH